MSLRKTRSHTRKSHKRRNTRKSHKRSHKRGGFLAPVNETNMAMSTRDSLAQGNQYLNIHSKQHGGVAAYPSSLGSTLPTNMIASARTGPLDSALQQIQGMQDGGKRNKRTKHNKRSNKRSNKRNTKRRGGAFVGSPVGADAMLLPPGLERQAALNYEWSMAKDPSAFLPKA